MASILTPYATRLKQAIGAMDPAQRWLMLGLGAALAAAIGVGLLLNRPEWVVLVNQADPRDAAAVVTKLQELRVPYRPTGDGYTIMVRKSDRYAAQLALAQAGLPKGGSVGMELFDEPKIGATEFDRKVNYHRALEGEMERALVRISDLEYAKVSLAIPERSVFIREAQQAKASVLVQPYPGRRISQEQVVAIVSFVSGSVQGLEPANVTVVDQTGRLLSSLVSEGTVGLDDEHLQRQLQLQQVIEHRVQTQLESIFSPGNVVAKVSLELNMDASRMEKLSVADPVPRRTETTRESSQAASGSANGQTGVPVYQGQSSTPATDSYRSTTTTEYEVSQSKEVTVTAPGAVKQISVGVAINRETLRPDEIRQIQEMVARASGAELSAVSVVAMPFTREMAQVTAPAGALPFDSGWLAMALAVVAALLLIVYLIARIRRSTMDSRFEVAMAGVPGGGQMLGSTVDVALGLQLPDPENLAGGQGAGSASGQTPAPGSPSAAAYPASRNPAARAGRPAAPAIADEADPDFDEEPPRPTGPSASQRAKAAVRKKIEEAMSMTGHRQIELDIQPVDPILMAHISDLIETSPEACAEMIRQWLKGGSDTWSKSKR